MRVDFKGKCLKQDKITYTHGKGVDIYIVYVYISIYWTMENCLFVAVSLTKNAYIDTYKCSGYKIAFNRHGLFSSS